LNIIEAFMDFALLGSEWVLWLLVVLSILSVSVMIERALFYYRIRLNFPEFSQHFSQLLIEDDQEGLKKLCHNRDAIECQVVLQGLDGLAKGPHAAEQKMNGYLVGQKQVLDRGLVILGTLGNNAPFIGLFGTVIGIIVAFHALGQNVTGGASTVMAGISEALVATAVGLMVAIPAVVSYNGYQRVVKRHLLNAEAVSQQLVARYSKS